MNYREKLINLINKTKSDLDFAKKTYDDGDDDGLVGYLTYLVKELESINVSINEQPSEDSKNPKNDSDHSETLYTYEQINILANNRAQWQKEQTINKACEWLKENIYNRVYKCNDGLGFPTAVFLADFKKAMEG